jgi:HEPN domain-containing protein
MSNYRQPTGDDYPDASRKHVEDSKKLLDANRYDGAGYLAGYAVECILKTIVLVEGSQPSQNHRLNDLSRAALRLLSSPSCRTAKYISNRAITTLLYGNNPNEWKETIRYNSEGRVSEATARGWVQEAQRLYMEVINQMILDGVII